MQGWRWAAQVDTQDVTLVDRTGHLHFGNIDCHHVRKNWLRQIVSGGLFGGHAHLPTHPIDPTHLAMATGHGGVRFCL
jgi:hypothetical protein